MTRQSGPKAARPISAAQRDQTQSNSQLEVETIDIASLSADDVLVLWAEVERVRSTRDVDPELRASILRRCDGLADRDLAARIRSELDEVVPAAVLEAHTRELIEDRPTLGAFPRRDRLDVPTADEWLIEDPRRLAGVVREMARFTHDLQQIVASAIELADRLGIDEQEADRVICAALRTAGKRAGHAS